MSEERLTPEQIATNAQVWIGKRAADGTLCDQYQCCICGGPGSATAPVAHTATCPGNPANVVVSRQELSGAVQWLSVGFSGGTRYEYGSCEWCDANWKTGTDHPAPWHHGTCPLYEAPNG